MWDYESVAWLAAPLADELAAQLDDFEVAGKDCMMVVTRVYQMVWNLVVV